MQVTVNITKLFRNDEFINKKYIFKYGSAESRRCSGEVAAGLSGSHLACL